MNKSTSNQNAGADQGGKQEAIVDQAKHAVSNVAGQAREQVTHQLDARKDQAVEKIGNVADAIRGTGEKLKDVGPLGDVAGRAADSIERVADFFEDRQITDLVRDVERFARREPALFLGGAVALGLLAGRFLKSSTRSAQRSSMGGASYGTTDRFASYDDDYDYGMSDYGDDNFLADDDLEDDVDSMRVGGSYGGQRTTQGQGASNFGSGYATDRRRDQDPLRSTLPLGTPSAVGGQSGMGGGSNLGGTSGTSGSSGASTASSSGTSATPSPSGGVTSGSGASQGSSNIGGQSSTGSGSTSGSGTGRV